MSKDIDIMGKSERKKYIRELEAGNKQLREYVQHKSDCSQVILKGYENNCTCGFDKLLKGIE